MEEMMEILVDCQTYKVSKSTLIEKSDYFAALYRSGLSESAEKSVLLRGVSATGLELVLKFINTSEVQVLNETLEDLIKTASYLQVRSIEDHLQSKISLENCVEMFKLSDVYGTLDLRSACMKYMSCCYHSMIRRTEFQMLHVSQKNQIRDLRMSGSATLVAVGDVSGSFTHHRLIKATKLPSEMIDVRGFGWAVLDNYLFVVGGYRVTSQEISVAHCYNPLWNEWNPVPSLNQKRSRFKLLAVSGKLYAVGGHCVRSVECYDPEQDWWTCAASLPEALVEFSACACQGLIYVMGGYTPRERNTSMLRYSPAADSWSVFRTLSAHIRKQQMLSVQDTIYLVGGYTHKLDPVEAGQQRFRQGEDVLTVQSYSLLSGEWSLLKEIPSKSGLNLTCTLHRGHIYIMSRDVSLDTNLEHQVFLKYRVYNNSWVHFRFFPVLGQNMLVCSLYLPDAL